MKRGTSFSLVGPRCWTSAGWWCGHSVGLKFITSVDEHRFLTSELSPLSPFSAYESSFKFSASSMKLER
jgi:hypothetical protein